MNAHNSHLSALMSVMAMLRQQSLWQWCYAGPQNSDWLIRMVHPESRKRLAEALRHYVSGQITNDDLNAVVVDCRDRGAVAVYEMAWGLYDDTSQHKATGRHHLGKDVRRTISRWIAFLYSDEEYLWPEYSFIQIVNWPFNLLTFGWWEKMKRRKWEQFLESGDFTVWPFCNKVQLQKIIQRPTLLSGRPSAAPTDH
jgi:hypothetical protein